MHVFVCHIVSPLEASSCFSLPQYHQLTYNSTSQILSIPTNYYSYNQIIARVKGAVPSVPPLLRAFLPDFKGGLPPQLQNLVPPLEKVCLYKCIRNNGMKIACKGSIVFVSLVNECDGVSF